jgi:hypothetical protein
VAQELELNLGGSQLCLGDGDVFAARPGLDQRQRRTGLVDRSLGGLRLGFSA